MIEIDKKLLEIEYFKVYKEQIPFIGSQYNNKKILIIGESHYITGKFKEQVKDDFYKDRSLIESHYTKNYICDLDTRNEATKKNRHLIHRNIELVLKKEGLSYNDICFYNFFQKPGYSKNSLRPTELDKEIANETFNDIVNLLKPNFIFFVSKKAFDNLSSNNKLNRTIEFTCHPTCRWWHRKCKYGENGGKGKFAKMIKNTVDN